MKAIKFPYIKRTPWNLENYFTIYWRKTFFYIFLKVSFKITLNKSLKCSKFTKMLQFEIFYKLNINQTDRFLLLKYYRNISGIKTVTSLIAGKFYKCRRRNSVVNVTSHMYDNRFRTFLVPGTLPKHLCDKTQNVAWLSITQHCSNTIFV